MKCFNIYHISIRPLAILIHSMICLHTDKLVLEMRGMNLFSETDWKHVFMFGSQSVREA